MAAVREIDKIPRQRSRKADEILSAKTMRAVKEKEEISFEISSCEMECGGRDSNSHRIAPTTPSK